ncbi:MAG: hypothetical protein NEA02_14755 [Thermoanaerobaculia bacterium]|nr:hypothetical protein [Thermoanaerobaculia bacterium]
MEALQRRVLAARIIAVVADAVQLGFMPLFVGGAPAGFDAVLDVAVGAAMVALLGWHWAFLPAFAVELLPAVDLVPTWTLAVFLVTRRMGPTGSPPPSVVIERPPALPPADRR